MRRGVGDDRVRRARAPLPVAAGRVEPGDGVVDDLRPLRHGPLLGGGEIGGRVDARQQKLGARGQLVHDLRDGRPVLRDGREAAGAIVLRQDGSRHVARRLRAREPGKADVDDRHLDTRAGDSCRLPAGSAGRADLFARNRERNGPGRWRDIPDPGRLRDRAQRLRRNERLDAGPCSHLDRSADRPDRGGRHGGRRTGDDDAHASRLDGKPDLLRPRGRSCGALRARDGCERSEPRIEARGAAPGSDRSRVVDGRGRRHAQRRRRGGSADG